MATNLTSRLLHHLARMYSIEIVYRDTAGRPHRAEPCALLAVLRALGAPVNSLADVPAALRERRQQLWQRFCEPVAVSWNGRPGRLPLRLPAKEATGRADFRLELENGRVRRWRESLASLPVCQAASVEGRDYQVRRLELPVLPCGYHRLVIERASNHHEILLIAAPRRAFGGATGESQERLWGVFLPLHALHSRRSWGAGDLADLETLLAWVREQGGNLVGTLPLLAAFLDEPFAPSPYEPVSRLFWNEFYLDVTGVAELKSCREARELVNSPAFRQEIASLGATSLVDYRRVMTAKRRVLEICARHFFATAAGREAAFQEWLSLNPAARDYARFRAIIARRRACWRDWPARLRDGTIREGDYDPEVESYHLYVQWLLNLQFRDLAARARQNGPGLYLDLPLGVHRDGYDVWRHRDAFAPEINSGAPPDAFFPGGQDWGFPPLHPEGIREQGYRYFIAVLHHHLRHAGILRLDHVMGLHRLFWIPQGFSAREGVYVRYHVEEFYAILTLESRRHRALLVGEDLGTVPQQVRRTMQQHHIHRMYVLSLEYTADPRRALPPVPERALACLNTHDMPPFAGFWQKKTGRERAALPVFLYRRGRLERPTGNTPAVARACLEYLAASRARLLLVNLEDMWLETEPQNIPGTTVTYPNWRRRARYSLEEFSRQPQVLQVLREVDSLRRRPDLPAPHTGIS